jgi:predicted metal-dependent enzyme (double-stranded beta helix superfamily)
MDIETEGIPEEIRAFCGRCTQAISQLNDTTSLIALATQEVSRLLQERALFARLMRGIIEKGLFPDIHRPTLFDNELVLYLQPERLYSLRMYLWGPGEYTPIHDHNSWGVIGAVSDGYEVINYSRLDDETVEGYAELRAVDRLLLGPGECTHTLPLNKGIHKTGNPSTKAMITLSLYGRPLPRPYLQGFDDVHRRVYRIGSPRTKKIFLASQALKSLESDA